MKNIENSDFHKQIKLTLLVDGKASLYLLKTRNDDGDLLTSIPWEKLIPG